MKEASQKKNRPIILKINLFKTINSLIRNHQLLRGCKFIHRFLYT